MTRARSGLGAVPVPASIMGLAGFTPANGDTVVGSGGRGAWVPGEVLRSPLSGQRVCAAFGDSITQNAYGPRGVTPLVGPQTIATQQYYYGHMTWLPILTKGRFVCPITLNFGITGQTTVDMIARLATAVSTSKAAGAKYCVVMAGTNDLGVLDASLSAITTNLGTIYDAFYNAGITVIALTITPRNGAPTLTANQSIRLLGVNEWIRRQQTVRKNFVVVDAFAVLVDPTSATQAPVSGVTTDGIHPNPAGAYLIGTAIANVINTQLAEPMVYLSSQSDNYDATNNPYGNLITASQGLLQGTGGSLSGAGSPTGPVATGWSLSSDLTGGSSTCTGSKVSTRGFVRQRIAFTGTPTAGTFVQLQGSIPLTNIADGDMFQVFSEVDVVHNSGVLTFLQRVLPGTTTNTQDTGLGITGHTLPIASWSGPMMGDVFVKAAGTTALLLRFLIQPTLDVANDIQVDIGRVSARKV